MGCIAFFALSFARAELAYYSDFSADSPTVKEDLYKILTSKHIPQTNNPDQLAGNCSSKQCYFFSPLTYKKAREHLFGHLHLNGTSPNTYSLISSYCQTEINNQNLNPKNPLAPMRIPDPIVLNTEHVWPQSKFSKKFPESQQKPNLHILLPVLSAVNSTRSNHPMGFVTKITSAPCTEARLGKSAFGQTVFEPSDVIKGDVARALFYFSVRFRLPLDKNQEDDLRVWHKADPPDEFEHWRNEEIFLLQKDRNPFIDMPELTEIISDF